MLTNRETFGLLGRNIAYSFSRKYFAEKFKKLGLHSLIYKNFDLPDIAEFPFVIYQRKHEFGGMNVTTPYKESVISYLDTLDPVAAEIGAVNTIKFTADDKMVGFNTDAHGFRNSLAPLLKPSHQKALVLGTGGASKAVVFALKQLGIHYRFVSRRPQGEQVSYQDLTAALMKEYTLIINTTPLGTHPHVDACPDIPFEWVGESHFLFDLVYNPVKTRFLREGEKRGALIKNGEEMLVLQAEKSWDIWQSSL
ncbi:MAG: shikimate dehydrogenase [Lutibacter sp.]|jgi:shikimate dehydrogenase|nr:shikimate dehydrogenase [Lutibacter sp.]